MLSILPNLIARLKALVLTFVVADLEADLIVAAAERKADLLRQASQYDQNNLPSVAAQVRNQIESPASEPPLASAAAAINYLQPDPVPSAATDAPMPAPAPQSAPAAQSVESPPPSSRKKKQS